jgi:hypothetical protein
MRVIGPDGVKELWRFPGTSAFKLAVMLLRHPTYTVIICESDDWYSDVSIDVDRKSKIIRINELKERFAK